METSITGFFDTPPIVLPDGDSFLNYRIGSLIVGAQPGSAHYSLYILTAVDMQGINTISQLGAMIENKIPELSANVSGQSSTISHSLSAYEGQTIRVAYRLHDTESDALLLLDDVVITRTLGTKNLAETSFTVYPNPATNMITIRGNAGLPTESIHIADLNGRTVAVKQTGGNDEAQIDISSLSTGMYIVTVTSGNATFISKVLKQ